MFKWFRDWEYIGIAKEYHVAGFYWVYKVYRCRKTGELKKEKIYNDSQYSSNCHSVPMLHELIEK